jgi:DNA-binding response OmpR family regulator
MKISGYYMKTKILIVEDDVKTANLIKLYLQQEHYTVHIAYDGREGLAYAQAHQPDLIVLDLMLPYVD